MLIRGRWAQCDDGIIRPVIDSEVLGADGGWLPVELLVDVGADRTVLSAGVLAVLALPHVSAPHQLGGIGGAASTVVVQTSLRLALEGGATIAFVGVLAGFTDVESLDMSVLGRDILNLFCVIVDRPADVVCLVGKGHRYWIAEAT
jgi:hypothetical protein